MEVCRPVYLHFLGSTVRIPTSWHPKDKGTHLELTKQNTRVHYTGPGKNESDVSSVRTDFGIPSQCGVYYFEIIVLSKGREGYIGVGISGGGVNLNRLPGWEPSSYGYHGDDGNTYNQSGTGISYGPTFTTGDIIGCCINFVENLIFFTKNGSSLGVAFRDLRIAGEVFPVVGLRTVGEAIEANFGQSPFSFDIEGYTKEVKQRFFHMVNQVDLAPMGGIASMNDLVRSYLVHHGYSETARIFAQSGEKEQELNHMEVDVDLNTQMISIKNRQDIGECILAGEITRAIELLQQCYPSLLLNNPGLEFQLRCRQFVEIVREGVMTMDQSSPNWLEKAMVAGQKLQDDYGDTNSEDQRKVLEATFSLLAYPDPLTSSVASLLETTGRETLSSIVNSAILVEQNHPPQPPLERLLLQSLIVLKEVQELGAASELIDLFQDFVQIPEGFSGDS